MCVFFCRLGCLTQCSMVYVLDESVALYSEDGGRMFLRHLSIWGNTASHSSRRQPSASALCVFFRLVCFFSLAFLSPCVRSVEHVFQFHVLYLTPQTAPVLFLNRRQRQNSSDPFTSCSACFRTPYLGHKNKLYPSFSPSITVTASHPDNAIIGEKEAMTNKTAMFVYIRPAACKSTAQSGRLGTDPERCPPTCVDVAGRQRGALCEWCNTGVDCAW